ncbi:MAG: hypothetical protein DMF01_05470 [Verrucomicrobia bacterium]|nr:MAG: hypothetical protein DMF01_05470 [Verrucomicrobiota bacterium]
MAKQVKLKAEPRTNVGRSAVRKLRARGLIPAVIYGGNNTRPSVARFVTSIFTPSLWIK